MFNTSQITMIYLMELSYQKARVYQDDETECKCMELIQLNSYGPFFIYFFNFILQFFNKKLNES